MSDITDLQADIAAWYARDDLPVDTFITLAEAEMNRVLRLQGMQTMASATPINQTDNNLYYLTYPADMLELEHIESGGQRLEFVSNNQMNTDLEMYAYTIANELLLFASNGVVDIYYYAKEAPLADVLGERENLFTRIGYDALLYLCLDHAGGYVRQPNDFRQKAVERMMEIQGMDSRAAHGGAPLVQRG